MAKVKSIKERNIELEPMGLQLIHFGCKLHIKPLAEQKVQANKTFGCARFVHNNFLSARQSCYKATGKSPSVYEYKKEVLNPNKKVEDFSFLGDVDKFALENALVHVQDAYENFFNGDAKYPKFKTKHKSKKSYTTNLTNNNIRIVDRKYIQLPKLGLVLFDEPKKGKNNSKYQRLLSGKARIMSATVSEKGGEYYVSLCLEEMISLVDTLDVNSIDLEKVVALDMGLKTFCTYGNDSSITKEENPKFFKKSEKKLAKLQRRLAKKKKKSNNFIKLKMKINKLHTHIANQRRDHAHKFSSKLANDNQVCIVEDLNIKGMVKNSKLAKSISDAGWSQCLRFLEYKLERQGKHFIKVDRWFASSKLCSSCGEKHIMLTLDDREWVCSSCGAKHDRDGNAVLNLRKNGLERLGLA